MAIPGGEDDARLDEDERSRPAEHIAAVARTLIVMGPLATSISTRQHVSADQQRVILDLLPALADRNGLCARIQVDDDALTVTFDREHE